MKINNKLLLTVGAILMVGVTAGVIGTSYSSNIASKLLSANANGSKETTVTNVKLKDVTFETLDIVDNRNNGTEVKHDKKFRIPLGGGKYILGALVYHDCGHQFIGDEDETDATLGETLYMDNTFQDAGKNAFNFHILFALDYFDKYHTRLPLN